jgi:TIR domain
VAHIFISYSKAESEPTVALARDLEAADFAVWWDTSLLPDDPHFSDTIRREITSATAAVVIWTPSSVKSRWVYAEAKMADEQGKLIQLRTSALVARSIPLPFNTGQISLVTDRGALFRALERKGLKAQVSRARDTLPTFIPPSLAGTEWKVSADGKLVGVTIWWRFAEGDKMEWFTTSWWSSDLRGKHPFSGTWNQNGRDIVISVSGTTYLGRIVSTTQMSGTYRRDHPNESGTWTATLSHRLEN